jgi:GTP cyclohydrolase II
LAISCEGVTRLAEAGLPTRHGEFRIEIVRVDGLAQEVVVLRLGEADGSAATLVRIQSECLTGEVFGSLRCDCATQLSTSLARIGREGRGAVIYLRQEGRGIGLVNKIRSYALQDLGLDTVDANVALGLPVDSRDYSAAAAVIRYLGIGRVRLLTNNPAKRRAIEQHDILVVSRESLLTRPTSFNAGYLQTKFARLGHLTGDETCLDHSA